MDPSHNRYYLYFKESSGEGLDTNAGERYIPSLGQIYSYNPGLQRGRGQLFLRRRGLGFASFFSSLIQRATPLLRNIGSRAVDVVSNIAKDTLQGQNLKEAAIKNISKAVSEYTTPSQEQKVQTTNITASESKPKTKKRKTLIASSIARKKTATPFNYSALNKLK
jgi:hypothetical protein